MSPSKTESQRRLFGTALSMKRGESPKTNTPAGKIASTVSEEKIRDFASKPLVKESQTDKARRDFKNAGKSVPKGEFYAHGSRVSEKEYMKDKKKYESKSLSKQIDNFIKSHPDPDVVHDKLMDDRAEQMAEDEEIRNKRVKNPKKITPEEKRIMQSDKDNWRVIKKDNSPKIQGWDNLTPQQKAQIQATRPDLFVKKSPDDLWFNVQKNKVIRYDIDKSDDNVIVKDIPDTFGIPPDSINTPKKMAQWYKEHPKGKLTSEDKFQRKLGRAESKKSRLGLSKSISEFIDKSKSGRPKGFKSKTGKYYPSSYEAERDKMSPRKPMAGQLAQPFD